MSVPLLRGAPVQTPILPAAAARVYSQPYVKRLHDAPVYGECLHAYARNRRLIAAQRTPNAVHTFFFQLHTLPHPRPSSFRHFIATSFIGKVSKLKNFKVLPSERGCGSGYRGFSPSAVLMFAVSRTSSPR